MSLTTGFRQKLVAKLKPQFLNKFRDGEDLLPADPAVEEEVEGRVDDEEDVVEMRDADQVGRDAVVTIPEIK